MEKERKTQESQGVVNKASKIGRKPYKMRKTDFKMEDELAGSLRELRPVGQDDALRERFDSVFRRNLIELEDTEHTIAGKRKYKQSYKFKKR